MLILHNKLWEMAFEFRNVTSAKSCVIFIENYVKKMIVD